VGTLLASDYDALSLQDRLSVLAALQQVAQTTCLLANECMRLPMQKGMLAAGNYLLAPSARYI
jgi:hypothetical protein